MSQTNNSASHAVPSTSWRRLRQDGPPCLVVPVALLRLRKTLGQAAARILLALWCYFRVQDHCPASARELGALVGASEDTANRGLKALVGAGYLHQARVGEALRWCATIELLTLKDDRLREAFGAADSPAAGPQELYLPQGLLARPADLTATQWWVLVGLYAFWQRREWCYPAQETLADCVGLSVSAVREALPALAAAGYVTTKARHNSSNVYCKGATLLALEQGAPAPRRPRSSTKREWDRLGEKLTRKCLIYVENTPRPAYFCTFSSRLLRETDCSRQPPKRSRAIVRGPIWIVRAIVG